MWECKTTTRNSFRSRDPLIYGLLDPTTSFRHGLSSKELLPYTSTVSVYLIYPQRNYILSSWQCTTFCSRKLFRPAFTGITGIFYVDQAISSSRMPWNLDFVRHSWENSGSARWIPWTRKLRVLVSNGGTVDKNRASESRCLWKLISTWWNFLASQRDQWEYSVSFKRLWSYEFFFLEFQNVAGLKNNCNLANFRLNSSLYLELPNFFSGFYTNFIIVIMNIDGTWK